MTRLVFVTPVHGRPAITRACLYQRAHLTLQLAEEGIEADSIIVGDDENLATAEHLGMVTLEQQNFLGLKVNDGIEHACRELDADLVCFIGSDQWLHPSYLRAPFDPALIRTGCGFGVVDETGTALAHLWLHYVSGCGPKVIPRALLEPSGFRPCEDDRMKSLDASLMRGLGRDPESTQGLVWVDDPQVGSLRYVDFKSPDVQLHAYAPLARQYARRIDSDPWRSLRAHYPAPIVDEMRDLYRTRAQALTT